MRTRLILTVLAAALLVPSTGFSFTKGTWRIGALAGQVGLQGDVGRATIGANAGKTDPNSTGFGLTAGSFVDESLAFEGSVVMSSHDNADHTNVSFGGNYYFGDYVAAYPNVVGGVSFLSNKIKDTNVSGDGFGVYLGGGFDFELSPALTIGIQLRYTKAFQESTASANSVSIATADDTFMVLLRALYTFDSAE